MHELFTQVLNYKDLSKAGDLFTVPDEAIVNDLSEVINVICEITSLPDYVNNDNDQSVVEICITRVTTAIRETCSMEQHAEALVALLESCLNHNLKPSQKEEDPPHAKISSDIISCVFLNYSKKEVMKRVLPVAVKFLHKGNKVLSRNMASYLSLAAIENSPLLSNHIQLIIDSIISGNYPLCRVLPQIYEVTRDPIHDHAMALVSLLPLCELTEKLALLQLCSLIANNKPSLLEASLPQLCEYLCTSQTVSSTLQIFHNLAKKQPQLLSDYVLKIKKAAECNPNALCIAAQVLSAVGKINKIKAQEALNFIMDHLPKVDRASQSILVREATFLCSCFPILFTDKMLEGVLQISRNTNSHINQTSGGVTIVKVGGTRSPTNSSVTRQTQIDNNNGRHSRIVITPRPRIMTDSRSTGRLQSSNAHRSMTRLNAGSRVESIGGLHKSMTKLSSNQVCMQSSSNRNKPSTSKIFSGGVTVTTPFTNSKDSLANSVSQTLTGRSQNFVPRPLSTAGSSPLNQSLTSQGPIQSSGPSINVDPINVTSDIYSSVTPRRNHNTSVTIINSNVSQRISVFEPYPMRDTMQHFCEKHLDKIKNYMEKVSIRIPSPAKCTIEERRAKKTAKLHFACEGRGEHCLYNRALFVVRTRHPRVWIHLMFLALQARSSSALSSRHPSVSALKNCWDILKCETRTFLTLVTSAFPCTKDQDAVLSELRNSGYFDVFEHFSINGGGWGCFLCNHPERAVGFLQDSQPVIEGQLKEKKGRWRLFRRWRTRYFTLSGAHLSYKGSKNDKDGTPIDIHQIRSVKVSRGARNIPKAFEIFTGEESLILKPKGGKNAEEWVQCLSVVVAHSHSKDTTNSRNSSLIRTTI
ncbi:protein melted isoform X2 [Daktulosphaira vitifoliae]|uniref:protein melted isoform X2 n=1 Tax=Daktulosphaira vitifoliae TaxID=58002 RepID=UPI0021AAE8F3|nr:protein melted isoform X2 [Daktulosphaira vitifoliae]